MSFLLLVCSSQWKFEIGIWMLVLCCHNIGGDNGYAGIIVSVLLYDIISPNLLRHYHLTRHWSIALWILLLTYNRKENLQIQAKRNTDTQWVLFINDCFTLGSHFVTSENSLYSVTFTCQWRRSCPRHLLDQSHAHLAPPGGKKGK